VYNYFLRYREDAYLAATAAGGKLPPGAFSYAANCRELTRLKRFVPWLREADAVALQQALRDLDAAYTKFFEGLAGHPQPKRRGNDSFRVCGKGAFQVDNDWVKLPKIGWMRFRKSREMPADGRILSVTVSRDEHEWYASFCVEHTLDHKAAPTGLPVGIDRGIENSVAFSDGTEPVHLPVATADERRFLKRLSRQISRKTKGSNRRRKALAHKAKVQRHYARRLLDAQHKQTTILATTRSEIHIEDLRVRNMTASAKGTLDEPGTNVRAKSGLNRSLLAQGHGEITRQLAYKCARSGAKLIFKHPAHTSQECAECHHTDSANRPSQAVFHCVACGHKDNADHNAARVILTRPALPPDRRGAARGGKRIRAAKAAHRPNETRTQLRDQAAATPPGSTRIPAKVAQAT
jgi:putative transposase